MLYRYGTDNKGNLIKKAVVYTKSEHFISNKKIDPDALQIINRLRDAERQLLAGGDADRVEIDENRLAGFRAQPCDMLFIEHGADERLHHEIEFARFG